jgi:predicted Zn finger-like uncharacterized protein
MKFTCDSCGAQYLIADEKIGPRGVKVRCKKCSHVIILRPDEEVEDRATERPAEPANGHRPLTGGSASSVPVAPSVAAEARARAGGLPDELLAATSSDLGLSQEFRALGFDDGERARPRAATLSVGLDLHGATGHSGETSPFAVERVGGSLDLVPPEPGPSERTAVEARPAQAFDQEETEMIGEDHDDEAPRAVTDPSFGGGADLGWGAGLGASAPGHDDEEGEPSTRVENLEGLARSTLHPDDDDLHQEEDETQAADSPFEHEGAAARLSVEGDDDAMADMRSSLESEVGGLDLDSAFGDSSDDGPKTVVGPHHTLGAHDAGDEEVTPPPDEDSADDHPFTTAPGQPLGAAMPSLGIPPAEDDSIAEEIGSAFDAMFGGEAGEDEDPLAGLTSALSGEEANKAETRVFDTEAMAKVEAEQDRALGRPAGEAPEPKEWYVAIDEEQVGPLSRDEVAAHVAAGRLEPGSLCWRAGMPDWTALRGVAPLADLVAAKAAPPAPPAADHEDEDEPVTAAEKPSHSTSEVVAAAPPRIEPEPEPLAPPPEPEPAWRPSAASLLASLAAEELSSAPAPAAVSSPPAAAAPVAPLGAAAPMGALAASDALEKLLEGEGEKSAAAQFGAAEKSESYVRPLPRRADTVSALPLRDPTAERSKPNLGLYILAGFAVLGMFVLGGIALLRSPSSELKTPEGALASAGTAPTLAKTPGLVPVPAEAPQDSLRAAPEAAAAAEGPATPPTAAAMVAAPPPAEAAAPAEVTPPPPAPAPTPEKVAVEERAERRRGDRRGTRKERRERRASEAPPPPPAREERVERAPPPPPPAEEEPPKSVEDDLLGVAKTRPKAAAEPAKKALPDKLDDSDVLGVLRSNRGDVQRCLKAQADADPSLEGTMTVELVIRPSGRTKDVRVRPDKFKRTAVGECMVAAVKKWSFPQFSGAPMPLDFPVRVRGQ